MEDNIRMENGKIVNKDEKLNVILVDYDVPKNWEFHKEIEKTTKSKWNVYKAISNENHGGFIQRIIRYAKYFIVPMKIVKNYRGYNKILAWQQFYGLILAFYFRIFHIQNVPEIVVMTFIYKEKKSNIGRIYDKFMKYIVSSGLIKYFVVFSESEKKKYAKYFNVSEDLFISEVLGYEDMTNRVPICEPEDFYLSVGRSNRDYKFLIDVWGNEQLKIICDTLRKSNVSQNIQIITDCHDNEYFTELSKCKAVIVPLEDTHISSGQLVIIQAMMYGKPVIVTENDTVRNYVDDGITGLVIRKNKIELQKAIFTISDEFFYKKMSVAEREKFKNKFSISALGTKIGMLLS